MPAARLAAPMVSVNTPPSNGPTALPIPAAPMMRLPPIAARLAGSIP
ncbi:MAG: hypothetical protein U9P11_09240 [Pseudomonadota bacterium]|nr:hypothetical protein [Pseudomonadota bacterium]